MNKILERCTAQILRNATFVLLEVHNNLSEVT